MTSTAMRLLAFLTVSTSCMVSGFGVDRPAIFGRKSVVLSDSRQRQKIVTRTAWLERRGAASSSASVEAPNAGMLTNDQGLEYVRLVHPETGASSETYLFGGVVTSYKDADGTEFIAVRPDSKMDGSKPISGGLSHCWPQVRHMSASSMKRNCCLCARFEISNVLHCRHNFTE